MVSKAEIKTVRSLAQKKFRDELGLFVVEGRKLVEEALRSGFDIEKVYRTDEIGEETMSRMTLLSSPSRALATVHIPRQSGEIPAPGGLVLALDSVRDPGNVGTIIRMADWYGIRTILASPDTVDIYNPKVVQATMGAIFRVKFIYCDLSPVLDAARKAGTPVYGTFLEGDDIYDTPMTENGIIVMGSERDGISPAIEKIVSQKLYIPPFPRNAAPTSESLNVAVATAIICSEFRRRTKL